MVPLNHLSQFKNNHSAKYMFLVVLSCFLTIFSGLLTQASTNEIRVNYIIKDDPLAVGASVCDTDLDDGDNVTQYDNGDSNATTYYDDADFHW